MIELLTYVINSLAWSAGGFAIGWLVASARRDMGEIREAVVHEDSSTPANDDALSSELLHSRTDAVTRWLGVIVALLAIATVTQAYFANQRIGDVSECQAEYNTRFAEATQKRSQLANEDRDALQHMLITLYRKRDASSEERLRVFERWVNTVQSNEKQRKLNPLPQLPQGDCR